MIEQIDRYKGCLVGLAVGDALGTTIEFRQRDTYEKVTEMIGGGVFRLNPGEWTDDTSMALCLGQSLLDCKGFNPNDQMDKYWRWIEQGYMSSNGRMFDVGDKTSDSLCEYRKTGNPYSGGSKDNTSSGNGSLMRLAPIPLFYPKLERNFAYYGPDFSTIASHMSLTTHGSLDCIQSCCYLSGLIVGALNNETKDVILSEKYSPDTELYKDTTPMTAGVLDIMMGTYKTKTREQIKSTGYVIHTLEASLWAFYHSTNFEDGCILAVNLGLDSDTVGAVYGQIAGAYYGYSNIPKRWLDKLAKLELIENMATELYKNKK